MRHNFTVTTKRQKLTAGGIALILLAIALYVYMGIGKDNMQKVRRNSPVVEVQEVVRADMGSCSTVLIWVKTESAPGHAHPAATVSAALATIDTQCGRSAHDGSVVGEDYVPLCCENV
jgi:hypothetical protein